MILGVAPKGLIRESVGAGPSGSGFTRAKKGDHKPTGEQTIRDLIESKRSSYLSGGIERGGSQVPGSFGPLGLCGEADIGLIHSIGGSPNEGNPVSGGVGTHEQHGNGSSTESEGERHGPDSDEDGDGGTARQGGLGTLP